MKNLNGKNKCDDINRLIIDENIVVGGIEDLASYD